MLRVFHSTLIVCLSSVLCFGQDYNTLDSTTRNVIDSTYNSLIKKNKVMGMSIAIVDNGEIVYATGYGFKDVENQLKADANTIYRIGSCSKSFTALSVMQLQEKEQLDIENSIKDYLKELTIESPYGDDNEIYINDVMTHLSGLPSDIMNGFFCDTPPNISWVVQELNKQVTASPRRYKLSYSNAGYGLLGELIARVSGTSYSDYLKQNIFLPLEMNSSYVDVDPDLVGMYSKGYLGKKEIDEPLIRDQAAGLVHSSVADMARYIQMYLNDGKMNGQQILDPHSIAEMEKNQIESSTLNTGDEWGYGLYTQRLSIKEGEDSSVVKVIGHGGDTWAYHSDFQYIPELNVGAVILTNTSSGVRVRNAVRLLKLYLKETRDSIEVKDAPREESDDKEIACTPEEILGKYSLGSFNVNVTNTKKIKTWQSVAKIVFKPKKDTLVYTAKAYIFGFIPQKVKGQEFAFVKHNGETYFKAYRPAKNASDYVGVKLAETPISEAWKSRYGKYELVGEPYACTDCDFMDFDDATIELKEDDGMLLVDLEGKSRDTEVSMYLNILSDDICVTSGIGRGTGETVRILKNGNLYYSGYEFSKVD